MIHYLYIILCVQRTKVIDKRRINGGMKKKEKMCLRLFMVNFTTESRNGTPYDERNESRPGWSRFDGVKSDFIATWVWLNAVNRYHRHFFLISGLHVRCRGLRDENDDGVVQFLSLDAIKLFSTIQIIFRASEIVAVEIKFKITVFNDSINASIINHFNLSRTSCTVKHRATYTYIIRDNRSTRTFTPPNENDKRQKPRIVLLFIIISAIEARDM